MKKLRFYFLSIKNNFRSTWSIYFALIVVTTFLFVVSGFFGRLIFVISTEISEIAAFVSISAISALYAVCNMLYMYHIYFKKARKRIELYRVVGAEMGDILICLFLESLFVVAIGMLLGVAIDYSLHSVIQMTGEHTYLTWQVYLFCLLWTFLVPIISLAIVSVRRLRKGIRKVIG